MDRIEQRGWRGAAAMLLYGIMQVAYAQQAPLPGAEPPAEAVAACATLSEGAACSFQAPHETVSGQCALIQGSLACAPEGGPPPGGMEPPTTDPLPTEPPSAGEESPLAVGDGDPQYDLASSALRLPEVDAGELGRFSLALRLRTVDPITLALDFASVRPVEVSGGPAARFDPAAGTLLVERFRMGERWFSAELAMVDGGDFRFEVVSFQPLETPVEGAGNDGGDDTVVTTGIADGYPIVDTNQSTLYDALGRVVSGLQPGDAFHGQDGHYAGNAPSYSDNGDGTVSDNVTGLMWQRTPDFNGDGVIDADDKKSLSDALADAESFQLAGYDDWRLPTIKELYSLMDFSGTTGTGAMDAGSVPADAVPYIDTDYFDFAYGDAAAGERFIDAQYWTSTVYGSTTMGGNDTAFGVNFADGRIKGYPFGGPAERGGRFVRYVRGGDYGLNLFGDNGDGTVSDRATGLMWMQGDSGEFGVGTNGDGAMDWEQALAWCEGSEHAGHGDWRLPNVKELQSIVDYSRAPDTTNSAAIDPLFRVTLLADGINASGVANYPYYWSGTTHMEGPFGDHAAYVAFGEARGYMNGQLDDVHGAGAQRSDPKSGDPSPYQGVGHGPQGDVIGIYNHARCVRNME